MAIYTLRRTARLSTTRAQAWSFFSDPRNLSRITPPGLGFTIVSQVPLKVHAGLMIKYRVKPLMGLPLTWLSEITHLSEGEYFVDEQRRGPYSMWHHEHHFRDAPGGGVEMEDIVTYIPPFGPLGALLHPFLIAPQLRKIFDHRERVMSEVFFSPSFIKSVDNVF